MIDPTLIYDWLGPSISTLLSDSTLERVSRELENAFSSSTFPVKENVMEVAFWRRKGG
jgi:hypothetical protein